MVPEPPMTEPNEAQAPSRLLQVLFGLAALSFVGAGLSHVVRGLAQDPSDTSSPERHALFVLVDALAAVGVILRPRWLVVPFTLLMIQQLGSHGGQAWLAMQSGHAPRVVDVAVALGMPLVLGLLVYDLRRNSQKP